MTTTARLGTKYIDHSGKIYGKLRVLSMDGHALSPNGYPRVMWRCVCDCGREHRIPAVALRQGYSLQCDACKPQTARWKEPSTPHDTQLAVEKYELTEDQWTQVAPLLPGKVTDWGRTARCNRSAINGALWVLRSGSPWRALPERYGSYQTLHQRYKRWSEAGVWTHVFAVLLSDPSNADRAQDALLAQSIAKCGRPRTGRRSDNRGSATKTTRVIAAGDSSQQPSA
jgi:putative transposase